MICENDPTLRRGFLNPFLSSQDAILSSFRSVLTLLKGYSKHGVSPISLSPASPLSPATFEYPIPSDLLRPFSLSLFILRRAAFLSPRQPLSLHLQRGLAASAPLRRFPDPPAPRRPRPAPPSRRTRPKAPAPRDDARHSPAGHRDVGPRGRARGARAGPRRPGIAQPRVGRVAARAAEGGEGERRGESAAVSEAAGGEPARGRSGAETVRKPAVCVDPGGALPAEPRADADPEAEYLRGRGFCAAGREFRWGMRGRVFTARTRIARRITSVLFVLPTRMM